jgi:DNA-binding CsgD family transcriptional regulator
VDIECASELQGVQGIGFIETHLGLNIRTVTHEAFGMGLDFVPQTGVIVRQPYAADHPALASCLPALRPVVIAMCADHTRDSGNWTLGQLFQRKVPQFQFSAAQRQLLRQATAELTDEQVADRMSISPSAVKKRWQSIHDRIRDIAPATFREQHDTGDPRRGSELRRQILSYVRQHPEELHPFEPACEPVAGARAAGVLRRSTSSSTGSV